MAPTFFQTQEEFRRWLEQNHHSELEFFVGFYKVNSGMVSMTWPESVDQALCFGWIDGVKRTIDENSYQIRFTPRKKNSIWSAVNIKKVEVLIEQGLMTDAGLLSYSYRKEEKSAIYAFEVEEVRFSPEFEAIFKANKKAWKYFQDLAPGYRKTSSHWVISAKQEATQWKRLNVLIEDSEKGINQLKDNKYTKK